MLSKLCKENKPEACMDCLNINCICTCHNLTDEDNWDDFEPHGDKFPDEE